MYWKNIRFIQVDCLESSKLDLRQANAVLKYRPDIILFEAPNDGRHIGYSFNRYSPSKKPKTELEILKEGLLEAAKRTPWVKSDLHTWENINTLWAGGRNTLVYRIDGPYGLVRAHFLPSKAGVINYKDPIWWARILLRDMYMARHTKKILDGVTTEKQITVLACVQKFHWQHVKFLLENPTQEQVWQLYFGRFKTLTPEGITVLLKKNNMTLYRYWTRLLASKTFS